MAADRWTAPARLAAVRTAEHGRRVRRPWTLGPGHHQRAVPPDGDRRRTVDAAGGPPSVRAGPGRVAADLPRVTARTRAAGRRPDRRQHRGTARRHRGYGIAGNGGVPFDAGVSRGLV